MRVITESWCFCKGVGKSERMKASIFSGKAPAMVRISSAGSGISGGTGFLIHRNLLLTTHVNLPSVPAAESAEIRIQNSVAATLFPHRFFITSSVLDLTIVGVDSVDGDAGAQGQQPHYLKACPKPTLDLGSVVYLLGYTEKNQLTVAEGKLVIATDNLVKLSTDEMIWSSGSAGFDVQGNLAFMICDPKKLAPSPNSTSSSSLPAEKKDLQLQFGIPIPVICDWLNQHWEGSLEELTKPNLPLIRLMSSGQKSEHSCASFTMRRVFKSTDNYDDIGTPSSSKTRDHTAATANTTEPKKQETLKSDSQATAHVQGIPTPEIYESPRLTSIPLRKKETGQIQLLDINFPPRIAKVATLPSQPTKRPPLNSSDEKKLVQEQLSPRNPARGENQYRDRDAEIASQGSAANVASVGFVDGAQSEVMSSSAPVEAGEMYNNGYSSEGETMYSAETAESRNYPSPHREGKFQQVGRSQSCVSYDRWGSASKNSMAQRMILEKQRSLVHGKKVYSQGAISQRCNDYFSPTVSSIMKKRNSSEQQTSKPRPRAVNSSPKWMF